MKKYRAPILSIFLVIMVCLSLANISAVFAYDGPATDTTPTIEIANGAPTPDGSAATAPTEEITSTPVNPAPSGFAQEITPTPTQVTTNPDGEPSLAQDDNLSQIVDQVAASAAVIVIDENGDSVPL